MDTDKDNAPKGGSITKVDSQSTVVDAGDEVHKGGSNDVAKKGDMHNLLHAMSPPSPTMNCFTCWLFTST